MSNAFYPQTDSQTEGQNNTIETYFQAFVNFEQNNWAWLLPIIEFAYNNTKNASTGHTLFKLNCRYHPCIFYKKDLDPHSKSKTAKNYLLNSKISWLFASKISITPKNFKNKLIIKKLSFKAMLQATKSSWVANTFNISGIASWKPSFLFFFEYYNY